MISRDAYTAVGLTEDEYRALRAALGREPNPLELGIVGALWSEHCSYKSSRDLLKRLGDSALSGANAGIVALDDHVDIAFKVESHNHPSYVEPYNGAATGVGGIIRDVLAMGAEPVAVLDSLHVGDGPEGRRLLPRIVEGIGGYGNAIGVPTVGGEVTFGPGFETNPLVNVLCVGIRPRTRCLGARVPAAGLDLILLGALTGRDGIHGASLLASRAFAHDADDDLRPSVQVADPFVGKLVVETVLELADRGLLQAVQDCGAAGLSSALAEMAAQSGLGVRVDVERVPLREAGLSPYDIMLSESQERMVVAVDPADRGAVLETADRWGIAAAVIGTTTETGSLDVYQGDTCVATLPASLLTTGCPRRPAPPPYVVPSTPMEPDPGVGAPHPAEALQVLGHPACRSRRSIYRQYDWMVKTATVAGPGSDAAVLAVPGSTVGVTVTVDGPSRWGAVDPYAGGARAVVEAAMNTVVVGGEPLGLSDGLNAGSPEDPTAYAAFAALLQGVADAARALRIPVTGGNVSLYNQTGSRAIWPTAVIGMVGRHPRPDRVVPTGFPTPGLSLVRVGQPEDDLSATVWRLAAGDGAVGVASRPDFLAVRRVLDLLTEAIAQGLVAAAHDISDGGLFVALAEMVLAARPEARSVEVEWPGTTGRAAWFNEGPGQALVAMPSAAVPSFLALAAEYGVPSQVMGRVVATGEAGIVWRDEGRVVAQWPWAALYAAWEGSDDAHGE